MTLQARGAVVTPPATLTGHFSCRRTCLMCPTAISPQTGTLRPHGSEVRPGALAHLPHSARPGPMGAGRGLLLALGSLHVGVTVMCLVTKTGLKTLRTGGPKEVCSNNESRRWVAWSGRRGRDLSALLLWTLLPATCPSGAAPAPGLPLWPYAPPLPSSLPGGAGPPQEPAAQLPCSL